MRIETCHLFAQLCEGVLAEVGDPADVGGPQQASGLQRGSVHEPQSADQGGAGHAAAVAGEGLHWGCGC